MDWRRGPQLSPELEVLLHENRVNGSEKGGSGEWWLRVQGKGMTSATALAPNRSFFSFSFSSPASTFTSTSTSTSNFSFYPLTLKDLVSPARINGRRLKFRVQAAISKDNRSAYDPELRSVLELATDSELYEIESILFRPSYFSPLIKSITTSRVEVDRAMIGVDLQEREEFISALEARFLFLAADARSTLRGWRPSYRNVLLEVRKRLNIDCSSKLSTEDLEVEIFLHLLQYNSSEESGKYPSLLDVSTASEGQGSLELGLSPWKMQSLAALNVGGGGLRSMILKGGGVFTLAKIYQLVTSKLAGRVLVEGANYQIKKELIKKGGQLAVSNLKSRAALLAAKQGFLGAAARYLGLRSMMSLLGPVLWGTFLADLVIQMLGTDYARILRTIYALAQIRVTRTYRLPSDVADK